MKNFEEKIFFKNFSWVSNKCCYFSNICCFLATNVENFQFAISAFKRTSPRVFLTPSYFFMIIFTIFGLS